MTMADDFVTYGVAGSEPRRNPSDAAIIVPRYATVAEARKALGIPLIVNVDDELLAKVRGILRPVLQYPYERKRNNRVIREAIASIAEAYGVVELRVRESGGVQPPDAPSPAPAAASTEDPK